MKRIRMAAYCRVGNHDDNQGTSFDLQKEHYKRLIQENPKWELVKIYEDIGSANAKERPGFCTMIQDARNGRIDRIITKSISRFARDTAQLLKHLREMKELGVFVDFEVEGLSTDSVIDWLKKEGNE